MIVETLHRYPVKGLSPERLDGMALAPGAFVPGDRLFAIENGPSGFDPAAPRYQPKVKFLTLMRNEALARLRTRYDDRAGELHVEADGASIAGDLSTETGRHAVASFIGEAVAGELRGEPKVLTAPPGFRFTDTRSGYVSLINLASVAAVEDLVGRPVNPLRFRGNVAVSGLAPWAEFDLVGRVLETGSGLRLKATGRIRRCAAVDVDPDTGERDLSVPPTLMRSLGHADFGIYLEVLAGGVLKPGDILRTAADRQGALDFG